jgi:hypothetical protein
LIVCKTIQNLKTEEFFMPIPLIALLGFCCLTTALGAVGVSEEIRFSPGDSSAVVEGAVIRGDQDEYLLAAEAGQFMRVIVIAEEDNAVFQIYGEVEGTWTPLIGADEGDDATEWEDELPGGGSGLFKIVVGPTRGNATYTLEVEID